MLQLLGRTLRFLCFRGYAMLRDGVLGISGGMDNFSNPGIVLVVGIELLPMLNSLENLCKVARQEMTQTLN